MKKIIFLAFYFGKWPEWMELYIDSIKRNPSIDFFFTTDCDTSVIENIANIRFRKISFDDYIQEYKKILKTEINIDNPVKICDLRPFFGLIHQKDIAGYDFFGWTDLDIIFGDIRSFYTEDILNKYEVLSTHKMRLAGHCALLKNNKKYREMGYKVYNWKGALQNPNFVGIDEHGMSNALCMTFFDKLAEKFKLSKNNFLLNRLRKWKTRNYYFVEQYTTPFVPIAWIDGSINSEQPKEWYYDKGNITNSSDGNRKFMYLHLMNFKSDIWRADGTPAPWIDGFTYEVNDLEGKIKIDGEGIKNV